MQKNLPTPMKDPSHCNYNSYHNQRTYSTDYKRRCTALLFEFIDLVRQNIPAVGSSKTI